MSLDGFITGPNDGVELPWAKAVNDCMNGYTVWRAGGSATASSAARPILTLR